MNSEEFINIIKNSEWYKDEITRNTIISDFIEKLNRENTIGEIILVNSLYDEISSKEKYSSKYSSTENYDFFENNNDLYDYSYNPKINVFSKEESSTGISNVKTNNDNQFLIVVNDIFDKFIQIQDNNNQFNTLSLRRDAFQNFMKFVNKEYRLKNQ
jgi:hypothetical protein